MHRAFGLVTIATILLGMAPATFAADPQDFQVRTTDDLLDLCSAEGSDLAAAEAVNFCLGYAVGAVHYHLATTEAGTRDRFLCIPNPPPSRASVLREFVAWGAANPGHASDSALDGLFIFLEQRFHCPKEK